MTYIFSHEDTDVALLPTAIREWAFSWPPVLTPAAALIGGVLAARGLRHDRGPGTSGAMFALLTTFITYAATRDPQLHVRPDVFYFALPLLAVVLAMPSRMFGLSKRALGLAVAALLMCDVGLFALRSARLAAISECGDPRPLNQFVGLHVPAGSVVVGPRRRFLCCRAERLALIAPSGRAQQRGLGPLGTGDSNSESVRHAARFPADPVGDPFFELARRRATPQWAYRCARAHRWSAHSGRRPLILHLLGSVGRPLDRGYPATALYLLPPGCPSGYDPTIGH